MVVLATSSRSPLLLVCAAILALMAARVWPMTWRQWRHGRRIKWRGRDYSEARRDDMERGMGAAAVGATALVLCVAVIYLLGHGLAYTIALLLTGIVFLGAGALLFTIHFFRKPQWAIAPVMRDPVIADPAMREFKQRFAAAQERFGRDLSASGAQWRATSARLRSDAPISGPELAERYEASAAPLRLGARRFAEIDAPADAAAPMGRLVEVIQELSGQWERMAEAARAGDWTGWEQIRDERAARLEALDGATAAVEAVIDSHTAPYRAPPEQGPSALSRV